jgi:hypothetical protein
LHLDTGEVVEATVSSMRSQSTNRSKIAARSRTWTRWTGTPDDIVAFSKAATAQVSERSSEAPPTRIGITLNDNDEERYFDISTFEREMRSADPGTPGARVREIQQIDIDIGPTQKGALKVNARFGRALPTTGVLLSLEGTDRAVVSGLKDELAPLIDAGRPRMPALPGPVQMFVFGIVGIAYAFGFYSLNWSFLPAGLVGNLLWALLYLLGFIAVLYAGTAGMALLLPPLTLVRKGEKTRSQQWKPRVVKVCGAVAAALLPFVLELIFGS